MKILYFAWVREKIGVSSEEIELPEDIKTIDTLLNWMCKKSHIYNEALADKELIRFSVNLEFANINHKVKNNDEIAIFPPVTGG